MWERNNFSYDVFCMRIEEIEKYGYGSIKRKPTDDERFILSQMILVEPSFDNQDQSR